jgi:hypothetical protein
MAHCIRVYLEGKERMAFRGLLKAAINLAWVVA